MPGRRGKHKIPEGSQKQKDDERAGKKGDGHEPDVSESEDEGEAV